ncbi:MAG: hypothetical protein ACYDH4_02385 [Candidatus Cryosericum sp.]
MRKLRLICCLIVALMCCSFLTPVANATSTFAANLDLYTSRNRTTSDATQELTTYTTAELLFARTLKGTTPQYRLLDRAYVTVLNQLNSATRRVVRDQRASDKLLADILALAGGNRVQAAWILLKRGTAGQERFLTTIAQAQLLVGKCKVLHTQLTRTGG